MGQRSQIYIAYKSPKEDQEALSALYFQWNFGSRMVSRASALLQWIDKNKNYMYANDMFMVETEKKIKTMAEVNFDFVDVVPSINIIKEYEKYFQQECSPKEYIYDWQDNNDGKLFIHTDGNKIKYAFTDSERSKPMTAKEYMEWGDYDTEEPDSNYSENVKTIEKIGMLMTMEELEAFVDAEYKNVPKQAAKTLLNDDVVDFLKEHKVKILEENTVKNFVKLSIGGGNDEFCPIIKCTNNEDFIENLINFVDEFEPDGECQERNLVITSKDEENEWEYIHEMSLHNFPTGYLELVKEDFLELTKDLEAFDKNKSGKEIE